jgi:hypothetical protein
MLFEALESSTPCTKPFSGLTARPPKQSLSSVKVYRCSTVEPSQTFDSGYERETHAPFFCNIQKGEIQVTSALIRRLLQVLKKQGKAVSPEDGLWEIAKKESGGVTE